MNKFFTVSFSLVMMISQAYSVEDPTRPPGRQNYTQNSEKSTKKLHLQGLVFGERSWIVINNMVLQEGQSKRGISVLKINKNRVLVNRNGNEIWLKWQTAIVKKNLNLELIK